MKIWIGISLCLCLTGCHREDKMCLRKSGETELRTVHLSEFNNLVIHDNFDVTLIPSNEFRAILEGGANLLDVVDFTVKNDTLIVSNAAKCDWFRQPDKRGIKLDLYCKGFRHLTYTGSKSVRTSDTLRNPHIQVETWDAGGDIFLTVDTDTLQAGLHTGPCDITIDGRSRISTMYAGGNGVIDFLGLNSDEVYINNSGTNNFYVFANNYLDVQIFSIGNVYYTGTPVITSRINGSGQLLPAD